MPRAIRLNPSFSLKVALLSQIPLFAISAQTHSSLPQLIILRLEAERSVLLQDAFLVIKRDILRGGVSWGVEGRSKKLNINLGCAFPSPKKRGKTRVSIHACFVDTSLFSHIRRHKFNCFSTKQASAFGRQPRGGGGIAPFCAPLGRLGGQVLLNRHR